MSWRVAVTRDEPADGPLSAGLRARGFVVVACPVSEARPPEDAAALAAAARDLERFAWVVFASARAVDAVVAVRAAPWPRGLRTAAVGARTADALVAAGADPPPIVADTAGADALWARLQPLDTWSGTRVLVPAVAGGRRTVVDGLRSAGASVTEIEAYRMIERPATAIEADWRAAAPDAAVIASPSVARALVAALGAPALTSLVAVVAIGETTRAELDTLGVRASVPAEADFTAVARHLAAIRDAATAAR